MGFYEFKEEDAYAFARHVRSKTKPYNGELRFQNTCPYCGGGQHRDKDTFSISLTTGQYKCLRSSCGVHGNMIQLSKDFDFSLGESVDEYYRPKKEFKKLATPKAPIIPEPGAIEYLESRGIPKAIAEKFEITIHSKHPDWLVFPFFDENNKMQFIKYRDTKFFQGKTYVKDGETVKSSKEWTEAGCKPILFGMKQCNDKFDRLIITEGQLDSLSVAAAGVENATSVPTGSLGMTWVPYCFNWVCKFEEIIVFGDFEKGKMSLIDDIKRRFPNKMKRVREESYQGCKDANEILRKYGPEAVKSAVDTAEFIPLEQVINLADVKDINPYDIKKLRTGIKTIDNTLYGGLPFGTLCVLTGRRGEGKSTLGSQIVAQATEQGYVSFTYSGELPNYLYKSWFDFQIAGPNHITESETKNGYSKKSIPKKAQHDINEWYRDKVWIYDSTIIDGRETVGLLELVKKFIMQYGAKVIFLDNLMSAMYLDMMIGSDKYEQQGIFVNELAKIALMYDVLIILVAHKRKNGFSKDENDEINGSGDISNLAGIVISYGIDKDLDISQRRVIISKNRLFGKTDLKGSVLNFEPKSKRIYGTGDNPDVKFGWEHGDGFEQVDQMELPWEV